MLVVVFAATTMARPSKAAEVGIQNLNEGGLIFYLNGEIARSTPEELAKVITEGKKSGYLKT